MEAAEIAAWIRLIGYLFCAVLVAETAALTQRIRVALFFTAGGIGLQAFGALMIALHETAIRDLILNNITTPYTILSSLIWLNTFWRIGKST